jgi:hypothetical protein
MLGRWQPERTKGFETRDLLLPRWDGAALSLSVAEVAERVDATDLKSVVERRAGSSPVFRTKRFSWKLERESV